MENETLLSSDSEFDQINQLYDECLNYLQTLKSIEHSDINFDYEKEKDKKEYEDPIYETINPKPRSQKSNNTDKTIDSLNNKNEIHELNNNNKIKYNKQKQKEQPTEPKEVRTNKSKKPHIEAINNASKLPKFKVENEVTQSTHSLLEPKSERLRMISEQLPKIIITKTNSTVEVNKRDDVIWDGKFQIPKPKKKAKQSRSPSLHRMKSGYGDFPKRLVSKTGVENVALISNVPYEKLRLLNDTFHTLINLRWRWIVVSTIVVHFSLWLVFAVFWYITALAHYDFSPDPPRRPCITGGTDFVTIFLASVEAQTTIGFGDRAIDEECPEAIFLFIMQLILGTGLSGVLTCVVYAKLTRPEKLSRDGVGFSKKAVISLRDGRLCFMVRAWDLNYDHIIGSEFSAHFIHTYKTKEGENVRYYSRAMPLQTQQFLLWPVILVHVIDENSPLYRYTPVQIASCNVPALPHFPIHVIDENSPLYRYTPVQIASCNFEITISLKGASASMGTFTQSQTSYTPREIVWGHRFPPVVKYDSRKQKYVIDHKSLHATESVDTPYCSASELYSNSPKEDDPKESSSAPPTPSSFSDRISGFIVERTSSFRKKEGKLT